MIDKKSVIYALISALLWSTVATAFKIGLNYASVEYLLLIAIGFSLIVFLVFNLKSGGRVLPGSISKWLMSAAYGFLNPFLYYLVLFKAYSLLPAQEALTLNYTWTITIVIFSILILKQKIDLKSIVSLLISLCGVIIIATHGNISDIKFSSTLGVVLGVVSSIIWGLFWTLSVKDNRKESEKLSQNFMFGFIYILIYNSLFGNFSEIGYELLSSGAYIGLFEMGITFILWHLALRYSNNSTIPANIILLSPFLSLFIISIVLGEKILISTWIGLVLIIFNYNFLQIYKAIKSARKLKNNAKQI